MSQQLIYTSAPRGLKPGTRGFCTVATTPGMPANLADRLESLSGYRHMFAPGDPRNPVNYSFLSIILGGRPCFILSRVADAGLDYTQRTNKLAHHLVLQQKELPPGGPAVLLSQPSLFLTAWEGEPRTIPPKTIPQLGTSPARCAVWEQVTGDAGWGGYLAELAGRSGSTVTVIFQPGMPLLELIAESIALLPPEQKWQTTFSTYFNKLPPGVECRWRCVPVDSAEAQQAARVPGAIVLDIAELKKSGTTPPEDALIEAARTGRLAPVRAPKPPDGVAAVKLADQELEDELRLADEPESTDQSSVAFKTRDGRSSKPLFPAGNHSDQPLLPLEHNSILSPKEQRKPKKKRPIWLYVTGTVVLLIATVAGTFALLHANGLLGLENLLASATPIANTEPTDADKEKLRTIQAAERENARKKAEDDRIAKEREDEENQKQAEQERQEAEAKEKKLKQEDEHKKKLAAEEQKKKDEQTKKAQAADRLWEEFRNTVKAHTKVALPQVPKPTSVGNPSSPVRSMATLIPGDWKTVQDQIRLSLVGTGKNSPLLGSAYLSFSKSTNPSRYEVSLVRVHVAGEQRISIGDFTLDSGGLLFEWRNIAEQEPSVRELAACLNNCILLVHIPSKDEKYECRLRRPLALDPCKIDARSDSGRFRQPISGVPEDYQLEFQLVGIPGVPPKWTNMSLSFSVEERVGVRVYLRDNVVQYQLVDVGNVLGSGPTAGISVPRIEREIVQCNITLQRRKEENFKKVRREFLSKWETAPSLDARQAVEVQAQKRKLELDSIEQSKTDRQIDDLNKSRLVLEQVLADAAVHVRVYANVYDSDTKSDMSKQYPVEIATTKSPTAGGAFGH